jgi:hypothetical protein
MAKMDWSRVGRESRDARACGKEGKEHPEGCVCSYCRATARALSRVRSKDDCTMRGKHPRRLTAKQMIAAYYKP